jgi:hypothetical protein
LASSRFDATGLERTMDAHTFVAVTRTYGGPHSDERDTAPIWLIDRELGGTITKVEDASVVPLPPN